MDKKIFLICLLCAACCICGYGQQLPQAECEIKGKVTDLNGAIASGGAIFFVNPSITKRVQILDGKYNAVLPKGDYEVVALYHKRAIIRVSCANDPQLNLYLLPACVSEGCSDMGADFDVFSAREGNGLNAVVAHYSKRKTGNDRIYEKAILTFKNFTVYSEQLVINTKKQEIRAIGTCWVDDGKTKAKCVKENIDLADSVINKGSTLTSVSDVKYYRSIKKYFWPSS